MKNKRKALGKGLGALIKNVAKPDTNYIMCEVEKIHPNKYQPRKTFEKDSLAELANSIKKNGIIEPLVARKMKGGGYELIAGERRWRAARQAGLTEVPLIILDADDEQSLELAIIENIQREDLNPIEEAEAFINLMKFGFSQDEVADKVAKDRATISNFIRLTRLPIEVKDAIAKNKLSMGHAKALLKLDGAQAQRLSCKEIILKGLSVRATEKIITSNPKSSAT